MKLYSLVLGVTLIAIAFSTGMSVTQATNDLIVNGTFQNGQLTGWTVHGYVVPSRNTRSGGFSARLGSRGGTGGEISQSFHVPSGVTGKLSFWYMGLSGEYEGTALTVSLLAQNGATIKQWNGQIDSQWHQITYDISSQYADTTLTLRFSGQPGFYYFAEDFGFDWAVPYAVAFVYVDDVSVT